MLLKDGKWSEEVRKWRIEKRVYDNSWEGGGDEDVTEAAHQFNIHGKHAEKT